MLPSNHVSTIYRDKVVLLYSILMNFKFNVGNIIQNSLLEGDVGKSLIHPLLITQLCRDAKVVIESDEKRCNTSKYTLVVFNVFRVFCRYNLNFL